MQIKSRCRKRVFIHEKENVNIGSDADMHIGKDEPIIQFVYSPNLGLSSALELFTPEIYREEVNRKKMDKGVEE
ncbi:hypothetical protein [Dysgonomonas capnocytophagoides]|uniref:hypothetical protein n=1 Tax=Dysgonomonas capnocytophagoides TaxID=45254 RepID=UPI003996B33C